MFDVSTIEEMWDIMIEYVPQKDKQAAADHLIQMIVNLELPDSDFQKLVTADPYLNEAAEEFVEDDEDASYNNDEW